MYTHRLESEFLNLIFLVIIEASSTFPVEERYKLME
jgi:hypothetical protein